MENREKSFLTLCSTGYHKIVYSEWGPEDGPVIICAHGLTGNGHDFNWIAPVLAKEGYRVIAIDMPGRGRSDFLPNPQDYNYRQYLNDLSCLFAHAGVSAASSVDWIGISMGGLLGIILASYENTPIKRLIIDDIGPDMPQEDLDLITQYISTEYRFETIKEMEDFMRQTRGLNWGPVADEQWPVMAENNARALEDGSITYAFDPMIADVFSSEPVGDLDLWERWHNIKCPSLILRGSESTLFTQSTAEKMLQTGPGADGLVTLEIIQGCGHVPALMDSAQHNLIKSWLKNNQDASLAA
jgi:pimeloyl-ACP methyl ester carboxylesterase